MRPALLFRHFAMVAAASLLNACVDDGGADDDSRVGDDDTTGDDDSVGDDDSTGDDDTTGDDDSVGDDDSTGDDDSAGDDDDASGPDQDGDGSPDDLDCDDGDPNVFPGAPELCNGGADDDCDGQPEGVAATFFSDAGAPVDLSAELAAPMSGTYELTSGGVLQLCSGPWARGVGQATGTILDIEGEGSLFDETAVFVLRGLGSMSDLDFDGAQVQLQRGASVETELLGGSPAFRLYEGSALDVENAVFSDSIYLFSALSDFGSPALRSLSISDSVVEDVNQVFTGFTGDGSSVSVSTTFISGALTSFGEAGDLTMTGVVFEGSAGVSLTQPVGAVIEDSTIVSENHGIIAFAANGVGTLWVARTEIEVTGGYGIWTDELTAVALEDVDVDAGANATGGMRIEGVPSASTYAIDSVALVGDMTAGTGLLFWGDGALSAADLDVSGYRLAVDVQATGGMVLNGGTIADNTNLMTTTNPVFNNAGAGIRVIAAGVPLTLNDVEFTNNHSAENMGAAIYFRGSVLNVTDCSFSGNSAGVDNGIAAYNNGGAIALEGGTANISGSDFSGNGARGYGSAIYAGGSPLTITGCSFSDNTSLEGAFTNNGAIYLWSLPIGGVPIVSTTFGQGAMANSPSDIFVLPGQHLYSAPSGSPVTVTCDTGGCI